MPANILNSTGPVSTLAAAERNATAGVKAGAASEPVTVVTNFTSTSITGKVTTITTYSDGSVKTTVSEGDTVVLTTKKNAAA